MTATAVTAGWFGLYPIRTFHEAYSPDKAFVEGRGVRLRDAGGRWYLDARASLRTVTLGHDHPGVQAAIRRQLESLPFTPSVLFDRPAPVALEYAELLADELPPGLDHVRFGNTGSQAIDTALLLSRFLRKLEGTPERTAALTFWGSFHGSGAGPCALTGNAWLNDTFDPLAPDVHHVPAPGFGAGAEGANGLREKVEELGPGRVTAIFVEPVIQSSVNVLGPELVAAINELCDEHGIHLVADEISTGLGRTGALTRSEQVSLAADMLTLSKGMTSGYVPVAALAISPAIYDALYDAPFPGFPIGSTTDGHPLAMAAGIAVLEAMRDEGVLENVVARGATLREGFDALAGRHGCVAGVRGVGLLYQVELAGPAGQPWDREACERLRLAAEERGVLIATDESSFGVFPPLVLTDDDCDEILGVLDACLDELT